ncbi:MAG TPA: tripartite tricarboxylate transporter substrate-binding protein [Burkholderiaceae bacterium]|nr:tripartite tricarboxylate transporter substrate-binding protein [Burkholderiaceae bacterium]
MITIPTRRDLLALGLSALAGGGAWAQQAGDRTVRFILPNATGSGVDAITRAAQPALAKALGHQVIVDNQPGAGGIVGLQALARSAPDGFTLSVVSNNVVIFPSVFKTIPFDMPGDFTPIAIVGATPIVLVVNPNKVPAKDHQEFAALLKSKPDQFTYGSGGNGTILHLTGEQYVGEVGARARHIPYKGVGTFLTDLIGGQIDFGTLALPSVQQHIKSGALRAIGVGGAQRTPAAPDIPTIAEQGLPSYVVEAWFGVLGPKGMAAADVKRVHDAVTAAFADPAVREAMAKQGNTINVSTSDFAQQYFRSEKDKYAKLVKKAGIELQ